MQLTWQVQYIDNGWFLSVFEEFFMEFINIGPAHIQEWVGGMQGWGNFLWHGSYFENKEFNFITYTHLFWLV